MNGFWKIAFWAYVSLSSAHKCRSPIDVQTAGLNSVVPKKLDGLNFNNYDDNYNLKVTFLDGEAVIYGFNLSTTRPTLAGGGLDDAYELVKVRIFAEWSEQVSPHRVDNYSSPFELQLEHRSASGKPATVVVHSESSMAPCVLDRCSKKSMDPLIEALKEANKKREPSTLNAFTPSSLLPSDTSDTSIFYEYNGTVIGNCREDARYYILKETLKLPKERMSSFRSAFGGRTSSRPGLEVPYGQVYRRCCL